MSQLKVLFLTPSPPWPADSGGRIRTSQLIERAGRAAKITLFSVVPKLHSELPPDSLAAACEEIRVFERERAWLSGRRKLTDLERAFYSRGLHTEVETELTSGSYDLVHIDEISIARAVENTRGTPVLLHHHKLDARLATDLAARERGLTDDEAAKISALEQRHAGIHSRHAACSNEEARYLEEQYGVRCAVVPNGVDATRYAPTDSPPVPDTIIFLGTLSYEPNVHGLEWFVAEVLPLLVRDRPAVRLKIVGLDPAPPVLALAGDHVEIVGPVPDPVEHLHAATCSIAPLFIGGGTRIKILESLAAGCPVVSTEVGAEGLELAPDAVSIADDAEAFSAAVLRILDEPDTARLRARETSAEVRARYSWGASASALLEAWEACCVRTPV